MVVEPSRGRPGRPAPDGLPWALGAIVLWSTSATSLVSLGSWSPPQVLLGTHLVAAVVLNSWAVARLGPRPAAAGLAKLEGRAWACGLLGTVVYQMAYVTALRTAPPAEANLLNYLWPLATALLALPLRRERGGPALWAALLAGLAGVAVLTGGPATGEYPQRLVGHVAAVVGALTWGLYSNLLASLRADPLTSQRAFVLLGAAGFAALGLATGAPLGPLEPAPLALVAYVGAGPVAVAVLLWQGAVQRGSVQRIASAAYLTPVLSTLWLGLAVGAPLTPRLGAGLALVLLAALLPSRAALLGLLRGRRPQDGARA